MQLHWDGNNCSRGRAQPERRLRHRRHADHDRSRQVLRMADWLWDRRKPPVSPQSASTRRWPPGASRSTASTAGPATATAKPPFRGDGRRRQGRAGDADRARSAPTAGGSIPTPRSWPRRRARSTPASRGGRRGLPAYSRTSASQRRRRRRVPRAARQCYPARFRHFRKTDGYANMPLDGLWLRAPYLHNGSVPEPARAARAGDAGAGALLHRLRRLRLRTTSVSSRTGRRRGGAAAGSSTRACAATATRATRARYGTQLGPQREERPDRVPEDVLSGAKWRHERQSARSARLPWTTTRRARASSRCRLGIFAWYKFFREVDQPAWITGDPETNFLYGSIGAESRGRHPVLDRRRAAAHLRRALCPGPAATPRSACRGRKAGSSRSASPRRRSASIASPSTARSATRRSTALSRTQTPTIVAAGGSNTADIQGLLDFFSKAANDPRFNADTILTEIDLAYPLELGSTACSTSSCSSRSTRKRLDRSRASEFAWTAPAGRAGARVATRR